MTSSDPIALVTGADRGLGLALTVGLLERGWRVFGGQYMADWPELAALAARYPPRLTLVPLDVASDESVRSAVGLVGRTADHLDLLINNAGVGSPTSRRDITEAQDYAEMQRLLNVNALGPLRVVEALLPLLAAGGLKRLCFVSSEAGSIGRARRTSEFGYCMSKAALNMSVKLLYNRLRPEGYTFRVYHPGWMRSYMRGVKSTVGDLEPEEAAVPALAYFANLIAPDPHNPARTDEDRLVLRDWRGREWPW